MNRQTLRRLALIPTAGATALASLGARAAAVDVTTTVTDITAQLTPIGLIGVAVLGIFVAVKGYKWVRKALS
jgi:hypothetical protein